MSAPPSPATTRATTAFELNAGAYIRYADGSEELYDMQADPNEWTNVVSKAEHAAVVAAHKKWLPKVDRPPAPGSAQRVVTYDPATDEAVWEGQTVKRGDPISQ